MQRMTRTLSVSALILCGLLPFTTQAADLVVNNNITHEDVLKAQQAWGEALIKISDTYQNKASKRQLSLRTKC